MEVPSVTVERETIITAYRADEYDTKTQRDESDGSVLWSRGDAISLFYGSGIDGGSRFVSTGVEPSTVTNFTGTIGVITGGADISVEDTYFWGLYPYDATAVCDGNSVTTTLPDRQSSAPGTFANCLFPSLGRAPGLSMGFYNICGGVRFTVTRSDIKSVTLKAIGGESLTGRARVGFVGGTPKVLEVTGGSDEIVLTTADGQFLEPGKFYYFVAFPQALSEGIQMTFETFTSTGTFERRTSSLELKRSIFGTLRNVDDGIVFEEKTGAIPIEDAVLKTWLVQQGYDTDSDGEISFDEAKLVTSINITPTNQYNLQSLRGIEYMPNLESVNCGGEWYDASGKSTPPDREHYYIGLYSNTWDFWGPIGTLRYVDVSGNPKLKSLYLGCNSALGEELGTIDLTHNPSLESINLDYTLLEYPDISGNVLLKQVYLSHLHGSFPDLSSLDLIEYLSIDHPQDAYLFGGAVTRIDLDVSNMADLKLLHASSRIRSISDLSSNPKLSELTIAYNGLTALDVSSNTMLEYLACEDNQITSLDLSNNNLLSYLDCEYNNLTALDLSTCTSLANLYCNNNSNLATLTLPNSVVNLVFKNCPLGTIDVSGLANLEKLSCQKTGLTSLDISHNPNLNQLRCWGNQLTTLDVSNNPLLSILVCSPMNDAQGNNLLEILYIAPGQEIPNVTQNRSNDRIPQGTVIMNAPQQGGGEGTGNQEW